MKKQTIINIISYVLVIAIFCEMLSTVSNAVEMKNAESTYGSFFDENEDYDVFFLGSSKVINSLFPMQLWKDYGISSYNLGAHASLLPSTYWMFENALDYKTPKVIVIDLNDLASEFKYTNPEFLHNWMDVFGLSANKIKTVVDLNEDQAKDLAIEKGEVTESTKASSIEFLWDFCKYHSRWSEVYDESFKPPIKTEKGAEMRLNVEPIVKESVSTDKSISDEVIGVIYLRRIIEECKEKGIEVVLVNLPGQGNENIYVQSNKMNEIAKEYDVEAIDFMNMDIVDYATDFYDDKHLNPLGARKITKYIGNYLLTKMNLDFIIPSEVLPQWEEDYWFYNNYKTELFDSCETISKSLLMLKDDDFTTFMCVNNSEVLNDDITISLLNTLNVDLSSIESVCAENGTCFVSVLNPEEEMNCQVTYGSTLSEEQVQMLREQASIQEIDIDNMACNFKIVVRNNVTGYIAVNEF